IELVFRPRFYQKHKGFNYYEPWTYKVWKGSVTGYCTWWSYRGGFTQKTLDAMLKVFVQKRLPDFGYDYMQFDNCYQHGNGSAPHNWLNWDKRKYPGGWKYAVKAIRDAGMKPGIWVHRVHRPSDPGVKEIIEKHPDWFVPGADGKPHHQSGFCSLNVLNKEAVDTMIRALYRGLKEQGWDYVKIDGTGDLLRAYQNKNCAEFFKNHPTTPEQSLRKWDIVAREELGPDVYILACHTVGNARWVIGLVDGGRLSNDGFQPRTLAQYNFMEGVVWRNDPDHCDVMGTWLMDTDAEMAVFATEDPVPVRTIIRPAICAMSGTVLMVSDKVEVYEKDANIEGMKRSAPVLFTVPGQLYGLGRRTVPWWLQEIDRPFDHWSVLARIQWGEKEKSKHVYHFKGLQQQEVKFADLGLPADREYLVCEFWSQKFLGKFKGSFTAPAMDENAGMHVFAIREAREHPWVISTTRHLSQGGVSLLDERWDGDRNVLSGRSAVVKGDPYVLTIHLPEGFRLTSAAVGGEKVGTKQLTQTAEVRITPSATKTVEWKIEFAK
ncbi:MAG: alpha-galactosidase, partial [Phycisphaerae bacterium]